MLWRYLLILPFKMLFVSPVMVAASFAFIVLLPYDLRISSFLHRATFWSWRMFLGVSLEVTDFRTDPQWKPKIAVLNHSSYIDGFIVGSIFSQFRTIAAAWAFKTPIFGHWLKASKSVPLYRDKENRNNAAQIHTDSSDSTVTLTSEGTMTNGKGLIKFRTGAFIGKTAVQPIVIRYLNKEFNNCWIKTTSPLWKHLVMTISQTRNPVRAYLLEPYRPSDEEKGNPALYCENVRKYMSEKTGTPLIDATYKESPALRETG